MDLILMLPRELARQALLAAVATTKHLSTRKDLIMVQFNYHVPDLYGVVHLCDQAQVQLLANAGHLHTAGHGYKSETVTCRYNCRVLIDIHFY